MDLTAQQREVVDEVLGAKWGQTIVMRGYAGTGKTVTAAEAILETLKRGRRALVMAPTAIASSVLERKTLSRLSELIEQGYLDEGYVKRVKFKTLASVLTQPQDLMTFAGMEFTTSAEDLAKLHKIMSRFGIETESLISRVTRDSSSRHDLALVDSGHDGEGLFEDRGETIYSDDISINSDLINTRLKNSKKNFGKLEAKSERVFKLVDLETAVGNVEKYVRFASTEEYAAWVEVAEQFDAEEIPAWIKPTCLIVIDEASMMGEDTARLVERLALKTGAVLLVLGDPAQLQPVNETRNSLIDSDDAHELTEILRSTDNVASFANEIRRGASLMSLVNKHKGSIKLGHRSIVDTYRMHEDLILASDVVLTFTNKNVSYLNAQIREAKGFFGDEVHVGERLVTMKPVYGQTRFINSEQLTVLKTLDLTDTQAFKSTLDDHGSGYAGAVWRALSAGWLQAIEVSGRGGVRKCFVWHGLKMPGGRDYHMAKDLGGMLEKLGAEPLIQAESAYAMTVHKSQGSEWPRVCYIVSDWDIRVQGGTMNAPYTAVTRARENATIIYSK